MSAGNRRSNDTFFDNFPSTMGPRGSVTAAGGMQHLTSLLVNIAGVKSPDGTSIMDGNKASNSKETGSPARSGSLNESPERDDPKGVVLRPRERKQDKRNSAGNRRSLPPESLSKFHSQLCLSESNLHLTGTSPRARTNTVQRFSQMFYSSPSKEKLDRLTDVLDKLSSNFSSFASGSSNKFSSLDSCDNDDAIIMEDSWQEVVRDHEKLTKKEQAQQSAIWELLTTEVNYVRILRCVIDIYARRLLHLQKREERFLSEISYERLFSNIDDIYMANHRLWHQYMSLPLKHSRKTGELLNPSSLKEAFQEMPNLFKPYITFCMTTDASQRYLQHHKENNQQFAAFLQWADNQISNEIGIREGLKAHLTKPMQRLTRYKVILMRIKDETKDVNLREELQEMADIVDDYVTKVNNEVAVKQKVDKLQELQKKLGHYDCVESPGEEYNQFVAKYSNFKLKTPMRHIDTLRELLMEGQLKMKEGQGRWTEVHCFLFTDLFLITKASKRSHPDRLKIFKPPMGLDKIQPHMLNGPSVSMALVHLTDFGCLSNIYAFADDTQKVDQWFGKITEARRSYLAALGIDYQKEDPDQPSAAAQARCANYGRTFSVQSPNMSERDARRRSSTFAGSSHTSVPSLSTSLPDDAATHRQSLSPFNPQHLSRSPLRRPGPREASPLAQELNDSRRSKPVPGFSLGSVDDSCSPVSPKKRLSLGGAAVGNPASTAAVPSVNVPGHTASLESFPSSSGVSSVESAHTHSGSELSASSLAPGVSGGAYPSTFLPSPTGIGPRLPASPLSTINGEKVGHFAQDSGSSLSNGSPSDDEDDELRSRIVRPLGEQIIRVTDKRYSRSLNDLTLQSLSVCESPPPPRSPGPVDTPPSSSPLPDPSKPRGPLSPKDEHQTTDGRLLTGLSPDKMRLYLMDSPDTEATSV